MRSVDMKIFKLLLIIAWTNAVELGEYSCPALKEKSMALIRSAGYSGEEHRVRTEDGYVLTLLRVRPAAARRLAPRRERPVFLQHGLWSNSYCLLQAGPQRALPFLLSDEGYDVWMGNSRGNCFSQEHEFLSVDSDAYWNFSFHEIGVYDLPAVIEYVLNATGRQQVHYVGHSMGTTVFFVMASLRRDVAAKVRFMVALAPVATVKPFHGILRLCAIALRTFLDMSSSRIGILNQIGISKKTILHYIQLYLTGQFAMFDYGPRTNMQKYNNSKPLHYDIAGIPVPVLICFGTNDPISTKEDVDILRSSLGNVTDLWLLHMDHLQFISGRRTNKELFKKIIAQLY